MLKNDIEKTLEAHKPDPSEGFAEMIDDKVFHLMAERQEQKAAWKKKRIRLVPVTAAALVVVMCVGMLAANGHFGLINRPDEIRPGEGKYTVQPIETVLAQGTVPVPGETDETETSPILAEEDKNDALDRGSTFILYWNGKNGWDDANLQGMLDLCIPEWKERAGDTNKAREALKEILGNTSYQDILGYVWVSGESGDPVRTLIMQGYGKWAQTQISYDMKLEADGLWYIDPESIQITDPAANKSSLAAMKPEDLDAELERQWPGIAKELVPMNLSCESRGFRVELISGLVKERESWIVYSVQDLETDRGYDRDIDRYWPYIEMNIGHQTEQLNGLIIGFDKDERREFIIAHQQYAEPINPENRNITFKIKDISIFGRKDTDLTPLIEQYGKTVDGIESSELIPDERIEKKRNVLDFHNPLDIPIDEGVLLTGIGWIDYELHVQVHYTKTADDDYSTMYFHMCNSYPWGAEGYDADFTGEMWTEDSGQGDNWQTEVWYEYFSPLKRKDVEYVKPVLEITKGLEKVEVEQEIRIPLNSIRKEGNRFEQDGLVFNLEEDDSVVVVSDPSYQERKEITIPEIAMLYVRGIGEEAFKDCRDLSSLTIPDYVSEIRDHAFSGCENLATLNLPKNLETIGKGAFEGCKALTSIDLPNNVMTIGGSAFRGCSSLASVSIPNGAKFEGGYVFADCTSLVSVTLPDCMENLEDYMFSGCEGLEMVFIREGTRTIGRGAFRNCEKLKLVEIPYSVYYISDYAFENCGNLEKIELPEIVSYIGKNAFTGCDNLVCVVYEGSYAQQYCEENGIQYEIRQAD